MAGSLVNRVPGMKDRRTIDELSIEEIEEVLRVRKAAARLERLRKVKGEMPLQDPLTAQPAVVGPPPLPDRHLDFPGEGATAGFHARAVDEPLHPPPERRSRPINWAWLRDKTLLIVEVIILLALLLVFADAVQTRQALNREARQEQQTLLPSPTPTAPSPAIQVVLLPGGHTPPDSPGGPAPEPIPAHLRDLVAAITPMPAPTPGPEHAVRIRIPSIGVDAPVVEGDDWEALKRGVGHHIGSANPGERGNCIIAAHNDIYGEIFRNLPDIELGDIVEMYTASQVYRYAVTQKRIIEPTDVSVMYPTSSPVLTMISCYPYGIDTHRIVVIAELQP